MDAPAQLASALHAGWAHDWHAQVVAFDASTGAKDGVFAATVQSPSFSGVALVNPATGAVQTKIATFVSPKVDQAGGAYNGRYVIWKDMTTAGSPDPWVMKVWDQTTGRTTVVAASRTDASGAAISSSWQEPMLSPHYAAWSLGLDESGLSALTVLDLRTMHQRVVRTGHPGWFVLDNDNLIWAESPAPNAVTTIRAIDLTTNQAATPPPALANVKGAWGFVTNGTDWAWVDGQTATVYVSPAGASTPTKIGGIPKGGGSPPLAITDSALAVPVSAGGSMIVNLKTMAWTYDPETSSPVSSGSDLLVSQLSNIKTALHTAGLATLRPSDAAQIVCR